MEYKILFHLKPLDLSLREDIQLFPGIFITSDDISKLCNRLVETLYWHIDNAKSLARIRISDHGYAGCSHDWHPSDFQFLGNEDPKKIPQMLRDWNDEQNRNVQARLIELQSMVRNGTKPDDPAAVRVLSEARAAISDWADDQKGVLSSHMVVDGYEPIHTRVATDTQENIMRHPEDWAILTVISPED